MKEEKKEERLASKKERKGHHFTPSLYTCPPSYRKKTRKKQNQERHEGRKEGLKEVRTKRREVVIKTEKKSTAGTRCATTV